LHAEGDAGCHEQPRQEGVIHDDRGIEASHATVYRIRLEGHLGSQWTNWFEGLTITLEDNGDTLLSGPVVDQAALHGLLKKVRDLGIPLISVIRVKPGLAEASDAEGQLGSSDLER
jgi:hypothetical protein